MPTPMENDPSLARFRRGSGSRVGPPGPPPVNRAYSGGAEPAETGPVLAPTSGPLPDSGMGPITVESLPDAARAPETLRPIDTARPLFGELLDGDKPSASNTQRASLFEGPEFDWPSDDADPGRNSGIVSIVVGFFVGIVGVFIAIFSVRTSRRAGLPGAYGFAGVGVSLLSIVVASAIGLSWIRYEISLAQQCSIVGPGVYLTESGDQVTCH